ncbi:MAG: hypothetical protein KA802_11175 [Saprospiraceae bacterium]|nr:hypothetical protein [Saprospiraceae bacterium]
MKKLLIMLVVISLPFIGRGQQLLPLSITGGQQYAISNTKVVVNPGDSMAYMEFWCINQNCQLSVLDTSSLQILFGGIVSDTVQFSNIIEIQNLSSQPVIYYVQRLLINLITLDTIGNITIPVTIYPDFSPPLVNYISAVTTTDSVTVVYSVVPNDTSAQLKFWLRNQDCAIGNAFSLPIQTVSGFNIQYLQYKIPVSFPCGYELGIRLELTNSINVDTTGFECATTLSCGSPYVTTYDSVIATTTTANLFGRVETMNQNCLVVDSVALPNQSYFAGTSINVAGSQSTSNAFTQITNLLPGTTYWFKRCVFDSSGVLANCQGPVVAVTEQMPVLLAFDIQNAMTTSSTTEQIDVLQTSAVSGEFWLEFASNSNFTGVTASAFPCGNNSSMNFTGGQIVILYNTCYLSSPLYGSQNFQNGMTYWVRATGNNQNGETATSLPFSFIFNWTVGITEIINQYNELSIYGDYIGYIEIADLSGRTLIKTVKDTPEMKIAHDLKPGMYVVCGSGIKGKKFSINF